ncbi:hypothetical protein [Candidatus Nitrosocosmicus sp. R]
MNFKYDLKLPILDILYKNEQGDVGKSIQYSQLYYKVDEKIHPDKDKNSPPKVSKTMFSRTLNELSRWNSISLLKTKEKIVNGVLIKTGYENKFTSLTSIGRFCYKNKFSIDEYEIFRDYCLIILSLTEEGLINIKKVRSGLGSIVIYNKNNFRTLVSTSRKTGITIKEATAIMNKDMEKQLSEEKLILCFKFLVGEEIISSYYVNKEKLFIINKNLEQFVKECWNLFDQIIDRIHRKWAIEGLFGEEKEWYIQMYGKRRYNLKDLQYREKRSKITNEEKKTLDITKNTDKKIDELYMRVKQSLESIPAKQYVVMHSLLTHICPEDFFRTLKK